MSKTISDLRTALFDAITGVRDGTLDIAKARQIGDLAQVIVNTAKVEVDFIKQAGLTAPSVPFLQIDNAPPKPPGTPDANGIVSIRRHIMEG
jgi:hypothetical protein